MRLTSSIFLFAACLHTAAYAQMAIPRQTATEPSLAQVQPAPDQPAPLNQTQGIEKDILKNAGAYPAPNVDLPQSDAAVSVRQAAVECAVAQKVEEMGKERQIPSNIVNSIFMAGQCAGKVQTFMLVEQARLPGCFPKLSLDEGIGIFVNWARDHDEVATSDYFTGMTMAFSDAVPCMKK